MKKSLLFIIAPLLVVLLSGCFNLAKYDQQVIEKNQELSDKVQNEYGDDIEAAKDKAVEVGKETANQALDWVLANLTEIGKQKIEDWIKAENLNQYGDPKDTMYAGGSPLFYETGGVAKDKYEYILQNHPELVDELNLDE